MTSILDTRGVRLLLAEQFRSTTSQSAYAKQIGVSPQYLSDVLAGRREPGPAILRALGLEKRFVQIQYGGDGNTEAIAKVRGERS